MANFNTEGVVHSRHDGASPQHGEAHAGNFITAPEISQRPEARIASDRALDIGWREIVSKPSDPAWGSTIEGAARIAPSPYVFGALTESLKADLRMDPQWHPVNNAHRC
jgi:hypothetical protein